MTETQEDIQEIEKEKQPGFFFGVFFGSVLTAAILLLVLYITTWVNAPKAEPVQSTTARTEFIDDDVKKKVNSIVATLMAYYYKDVDPDTLETGIYRGILDSIGDPYTRYYTADEFEKMMQSTSSYITGIGVVLTQEEGLDGVLILNVYENTPAEEAGLCAGDVILAIDGVDAKGQSLSDFVSSVRGEEGSTAHIKIRRASTGDVEEIDLVRRKVDVPTIYSDFCDTENKIGYIRIAEFGGQTDIEFNEAYDKLTDEGMTALVIDLRQNPGGIVDTAQAIADRILPEGLIVYTEDKSGKRDEVYSDATCIEIPVALLINAKSASSAEILAGALKDHQYATLIGTKTYGKGIVQNISRLSDGSAFKYTFSRYFTPNGINIDGIGIEPDIELEYEYSGPDDEPFEYRYDNQIYKAIQILTNERR